MDPKTILVPFSGSSEDQSVLRYAFSLAEAHDAAVEALHVLPDPERADMSYAYGDVMFYPETAADEMREANAARRRAAEEKFSVIARGIRAQKALFHAVIGDVGETIAARGRVSDLIVMGKGGNDAPDMPVDAAIFGSGRPVLLLPPESHDGKFGDSVLVAWNGSKEAAQAVAFAMPYMRRKRVWVLTEREEEAGEFPLSLEDLTRYLQQHGIKAEKAPMNIRNGVPLPESILDAARTLRVGMIVMGAWGHSRLREYILGGVTRFMLESADVPLFLMH
ncbi:MAG: universal stress protein [Alphaproteobacteria bacterium]|nr:universal stress protein [Alphaproteobacteria bacterium]MDE2335779.1 universal stress protein [Alphaproteobacteria bacterium]